VRFIATGRNLAVFLFVVAAVQSCCAAPKHLSVDTGECGGAMPLKIAVLRTAEFSDEAHKFKAYGEVSFHRLPNTGKDSNCHLVYKLYVSIEAKPFVLVKSLSFNMDEDEIRGIDLIGPSPDGSHFAADFWWAMGDAEMHRPVVVDMVSLHAVDLELEDKIQKRINGCDQLEDFIGVTNAGEAVFAIPPSLYEDSPECGDKGLWHFDLKTGNVYRVAKISGDKWQ
jgi:hypothetical protein